MESENCQIELLAVTVISSDEDDTVKITPSWATKKQSLDVRK